MPAGAQTPICEPKAGGAGRLILVGIPIAQFTSVLNLMRGRTVVDKTGLTGQFDIDLTYTPERQIPAGADVPIPTADLNAPSIFTAVREQFGRETLCWSRTVLWGRFSEGLHITERFHGRDFGHIDHARSAIPPCTQNRSMQFVADDELIEYICRENEQDYQKHRQGFRRKAPRGGRHSRPIRRRMALDSLLP